MRDGLKYKLVLKEISEEFELIAFRVGDVTILGMYVRIDADIPGQITLAMTRVQNLSRGKDIVLGDFNAHHET